MRDEKELEEALKRWGEQLLRPGLRRHGRPGRDPKAGRRIPLSGASIRSGLRAIVLRTPEVMVKVTGGGRGMGAIKAHMAYISRRGELTLENQDGVKIQGKDDLALLAKEWQYGGGLIPNVSHRREAFHVMMSMPPGANAEAVYFAARAFAREEFAAHKYALVLHDPASDPDSHRPHVHLIVRAQGKDGQRLNPRKADLARWRQEFADRLVERGVAASATRRQTRGVVEPTKKLKDYHRGALQRKELPMRPSEGANQTEHDVLAAWQHVAEALGNSETIEDRDLGLQAADFTRSMQTVARATFQFRQRRKQLELEHERQATLSRGKGKIPEESKERGRSR